MFNEIESAILQQGLQVQSKDEARPWGGFFVIAESQAQVFANIYFDGLDVSTLTISGKLSPKILVVAPGKRLSWQYHNRRAEIWQIVKGSAGVIRSANDQEGALEVFTEGNIIRLAQGERHRLVGLEDWAMVAEIWQHTDPEFSSDEDDIIRVQDDFGR